MTEAEYETYESHSISDLLSMADDFRATVSLINNPSSAERSHKALPSNSRSLISVGPDGIRINFRSHAAIRMVMGDIEEMEGVAAECIHRLGGYTREESAGRVLAHPAINILMVEQMRQEAQKCLNTHFVREKAGLGDVLALGQP